MSCSMCIKWHKSGCVKWKRSTWCCLLVIFRLGLFLAPVCVSPTLFHLCTQRCFVSWGSVCLGNPIKWGDMFELAEQLEPTHISKLLFCHYRHHICKIQLGNSLPKRSQWMCLIIMVTNSICLLFQKRMATRRILVSPSHWATLVFLPNTTASNPAPPYLSPLRSPTAMTPRMTWERPATIPLLASAQMGLRPWRALVSRSQLMVSFLRMRWRRTAFLLPSESTP